jgi:TrpR-related protein YerC/YecD
MEFNWNIKPNTQLLEAIVSLENTDEAKRFLRDLMTEGEIEEFGKRLEAARLLSKNTQYSSIIEQTGLSSTTIARIAKWLRGSLGGYNLILTRIAHHHNSIQPRRGLS